MNKFYALIAILALLAIAGFSLFFMNRSRLADQETQMDAQIAQMLEEQKQLAQTEADLRAKQAESERLAKEAEQARLMAVAQAEKERQEREKLVAELNERLKREAAERKQAEEAQAALAAKMQALEESQAEAQAALAALEMERAAGAGGETDALRQKMAQAEKDMLALSQENEALKARQQLLEQRQIATEEAIISAGGKIEIPFPEIRSPNIKRREAIYFKERVLGSGE